MTVITVRGCSVGEAPMTLISKEGLQGKPGPAQNDREVKLLQTSGAMQLAP